MLLIVIFLLDCGVCFFSFTLLFIALFIIFLVIIFIVGKALKLACYDKLGELGDGHRLIFIS